MLVVLGRDRCDLALGGAVFVHVARGGQGIGGGRGHRPVGRLVGEGLRRADQAAGGGALIAAVGDQGDVAHARVERQSRGDGQGLEGGAAEFAKAIQAI